MKKILSIALAIIILFSSNSFIVHADTPDTTDYLTAEKMADNNYMTALLNELLYVDIGEVSTDRYEFKIIETEYQPGVGVAFSVAIIVENVSHFINTPNGTNVNNSTTNSSYTKRFVGLCDYLEAADIVEKLNSGEIVSLEHAMDPRIVEDLKASQATRFENYDEEYNYLRDATGAYNCHSYAWYSQSADNNIWLESPAMYYASHDQSYRQLDSTETPRIGDIIVYMAGDEPNHSGIIVGFTDATTSDGKGDAHKYVVESKWGFAGLYRHKGNECPYYSINQSDYHAIYYRLQSDIQLSVTNGNAAIDVTENVSARTDTSITSKEEHNFTCELDMNQSGPQTITISANAPLTIKLMDLSRALYSLVSCTESVENGVYQYVYSGTFEDGIYYVRAVFTSGSDNGEITFNVAHQHAYTYLSRGTLGHLATCSCGDSYLTDHVAKGSVVGRYKPCAFCGYLIDTESGDRIPIIQRTPNEETSE